MGKFNLSEAAKEILSASVNAKRGGQDKSSKLHGNVAYGTKEAGLIGHSPDELDSPLPDYLKGVPTAKAPGATPPVGSEPMPKLKTQPSSEGPQTAVQGRRTWDGRGRGGDSFRG